MQKEITPPYEKFRYEDDSDEIFHNRAKYCLKRIRIQSFSGPYFAAFRLNTERDGESLCIQSECGKIWPRKTK